MVVKQSYKSSCLAFKPQLDNDIHFNINNNYVYGYSEDFLNGNNLIASFKHNAKSILINSVKTVNNFFPF